MIAVLGTSINQLKDLIKKTGNKNGICEIANDNADGQVIISGNKENISLFQKNQIQDQFILNTLRMTCIEYY